MTSKIIPLTNFFIFLLPGILYVFMPYLTRKTESFGVSITEEIYHSEKMQNIRKKYVYTSSTLLFIVFSTTLFFYNRFNEPVNMYIYIIGFITLLLSLFFVYLRFHFLVKKLKQEEKWVVGKKQVSIIDTNFRDRKLTYSNMYFLIPLLFILASAYFTWINYDLISDSITMQYDLEGNPTSFRDKSYTTVFSPNIMQLLLLGLFIFINNIIAKAKQQIDPSNPESSALQNEIFRRKWSQFIIVTGTLMILLFSFMQITFYTLIAPFTMFVVTMGFTLLIVVWAIYLSITLGQGGSRLKTAYTMEGEEIDREQDTYWKLGQFYFNPDDPAVFIEKRFGIGWTINFASKKGWLYIGVLLLIIAISMFFEL